MTAYLQPRGEFNHLFCLDISQAVHASNTVTNREHAACLLQLSRGVSSQDALLQNRGYLSSTWREMFQITLAR